ncbi:MAG: phosphatase PAP2 family protein [Acidobacteria bacterium]|nr:phosphatase PAP2 family protein [Acidobacteriota bacterium]
MGSFLDENGLNHVDLRQPGLRPADLVVLAFYLLLSGLTVLHLPKLPYAAFMLGANAFLILYLVVLAPRPIQGSPVWITVLRLWYPVPFVMLAFVQLRDLVPAVNPFDADRTLLQLDAWLFGAQPSLMLQQIHQPWLTELLQYVYSSFYFLPLILGIVLVARHKLIIYDFFFFFTCYGFFLSYLGYFFVPAIGPRFVIAPQYDFPLQGLWFFDDMVYFTNLLESIHRDCFPSGHTMMTLATIHFSYHHARGLFRIYLPVGILLIFSTLYLRYHYGIDLIAGVIFYAFIIVTAKPLYQKLSRLTVPPE